MRSRHTPIPEAAGAHSRPATPDNPTDRVTSIDIARTLDQKDQKERGRAHPAVAGGQESRTVASPESSTEESAPQRTGVSSLEPSFRRALRMRPESAARRQHETSGETGPIAVSGMRQQPPEPPTPKPVRQAVPADPQPEPAHDTRPLPTEALDEALHRAGAPAWLSADSSQDQPQWLTGDASDPVVYVDRPDYEVSAERQQFARPDNAAASGRMISPLDETPWVAAIPRCCDTCREFQRDADGQSGYCRSPYAFGRRTMVKSDQLACRSSIGVWWLPSDDTWLDRADVSHHTRPTPYLDSALADTGSETR